MESKENGLIECNKCRETKTTDNFSRARRSSSGYRKTCKDCQAVAFKIWLDKNVEKRAEEKRVFRAKSINHKYKQLCIGAEDRNKKVLITKEEYELLIKDRICYYCDYDFSSEQGGNLNRVDSSKDYILENLKPCCKICNSILNNFTVDQLTSRLYKIASRIKKGKRNDY